MALFQTSTEEQQKFLRSTVPAGTAGAAEIAGLPTSSLPPSPAGFNVNLPEITSANDLFKATQSPFTVEDTKKLLGDLRSSQLRTAELFKPTAREQQLQQQIGGLQGGLEADIQTLGARPGIDFFTFGRGVSQTERETNIRLAPLQRQLGLEQQQRAGELAGQKFLTESTQEELRLVSDQTKSAFSQALQLVSLSEQREARLEQQTATLRDDARQALNTILTNFGGLAFENLDSNTQQQLKTLSKNVGLPEGLLREGMKTIKEKQLAQRAQDQVNLQAQRDIQNQIALMRLELAQQKQQAIPGFGQYFNATTGAPVQLNQKVLERITASKDTASIVNQLNEQVLQLKQTGFKPGARLFGLTKKVAGTVGFQSDVQKSFSDIRDALIGPLARAISSEVGTLTNPDIDRAKKLLPGLTDTPNEIRNKLGQIQKLVIEKRVNLYQTQGLQITPDVFEF